MFVGAAGSNWFIVIFLIICILNIILFFKVWFMTDDVNSIKRILQGKTITKETDDAGEEEGGASDTYDGDGENNDSSNEIIIVMCIGIFIIFLIAFILAS
jgi:hypothetical protein